MIYGSNQESYEEYYGQFQVAVVDKPVQREYFNKNWANCTERWVKYHRICMVTLGNDTNNRCESLNRTLKQFISKHSKFGDCILGIMQFLEYQTTEMTQKLYKLKTKVMVKQKEDRDEVIESIYQTCSEYSATLTIKYYQSSQQCTYKIEQTDQFVTLSSINNNYQVADYESNSPRCSCYENRQSLLPCKHIFFVRKHLNLPLFHTDFIPLRWLKHSMSFQTVTIDATTTTRLVRISYSRANKSKPSQINKPSSS